MSTLASFHFLGQCEDSNVPSCHTSPPQKGAGNPTQAPACIASAICASSLWRTNDHLCCIPVHQASHDTEEESQLQIQLFGSVSQTSGCETLHYEGKKSIQHSQCIGYKSISALQLDCQ